MAKRFDKGLMRWFSESGDAMTSRPIRRRLTLTFCTMFALPWDNVSAGYYTLTEGQGVEVCEAYLHSLNSFKAKVPMSCGRAVDPNNPDLSKPAWTKPWKTPGGAAVYSLYLEFTEILTTRDVNPISGPFEQWPQWTASPEQVAKGEEYFRYSREYGWTSGGGKVRPNLAVFDIDNDGKPDHVYLEQPCGSSYASRLAVATPDWNHIDPVKTERITPHPPIREFIKQHGIGFFRPKYDDEFQPPILKGFDYLPVEDFTFIVDYDVFIFKSVTYIDQWLHMDPLKGTHREGQSLRDGPLRVFYPGPEGMQMVCAYDFYYE